MPGKSTFVCDDGCNPGFLPDKVTTDNKPDLSAEFCVPCHSKGKNTAGKGFCVDC